MTDSLLLAEYLRARRRMVSPEEAGVGFAGGARRVQGLRREEVARLAGISSDYYLRLEQGRELHPSTQVLYGLARALQLDAESVSHLYLVARPESTHSTDPIDIVSPSLMALIASLGPVPLHVLNRRLDLLYVNPLGKALTPNFTEGNNLVRLVFSAQTERGAYWRSSTRSVVAFLRASIDPNATDPQLVEMVADLSDAYPRFAELWARHDVASASGFPVSFMQKTVGPLELRFQTFTLPASGGQMLGIYTAAPGGPSAEALALLSLSIQSEETPSAMPLFDKTARD